MSYHGSLSDALQLESSSHRPSDIISQKSSRAPSIESLQHSQTSQTLRKVRSPYGLSHSPPSPPDPTATSQRLPRNSARASGFFADSGRKFKIKNRPSTATGSREELPSWDRHSATTEHTQSTAPSIRSRASSTALSSLPTGRVEDVTPWELHPGPLNQPGTTPLFPLPRSTLVQSTGPIEDVTPWELHPLPSDSTPERSHSVSSSAPSSAVRSARSPSNATSVSARSFRSTATGPAEDVTPWELHPVPIYEEDSPAPDLSSPMPSISQHSIHTPSVRSHRSSTATGPREEVTPWELHPGPDEMIPEDDRPLPPHRARPLSSPPSVRVPSVKSHRPSTATGPTEEVAPWELYPDPPSDATYSAPTHPRLPHSTAPSLRSHRSAGAGFTEESTLWELHPGGTIHEEPLSMNSVKASFAGSVTPSVKSHRSTATGPMEVVTPWDLHPPGTIPKEEVHWPPTSASTRSLPIRSAALSLISHRSMATGPTEEVTPWELHPAGTIPEEPTQGVTPLELHPVVSSEALKKTISTCSLPKSIAPSVTSHRSTATGPIEDVTPWELHQPGTIPEETFDTFASTSSSAPDEISGHEEDVTPSQGYSESPGEEFPLPQTIPPQPARSMTLPSRSTTTGPKEEVTPWELHPDPTSEQRLEPPPNLEVIGRSRISLQMTVAQLQEVMPWELHPVPSTQRGQKAPEPAARPSTSTATNKPPSDLDLVRRRSTNSKPHKARTHPHPTNESHQKDASSIKSFKAVTSSSSHAMHLPKTQATVPQMPSKSSSTEGKSSERAVYFVVKGARHTLSDGISPGQKHHAYPREVVPYPRSYEQEVIDLDVWETVFCQDICESLTWHVFETPPEKVLEIGCGTGTWILNCARSWKETKFVGLDIVPLFPNMRHIYPPDLEKRITWAQGNFLEGLPFPNGEFDFVHIKRIALGVPEDKWDALFDEISRVMKPGAAFEMIEEDLFFPGIPANSDEESDRESEIESPASRRNSVGATITNIGGEHTEEICETSCSWSPATPTTSTIPQSPLQLGSPAQSHSTSFSSSVKKDNGVAPTTPPDSPPTIITMVPPHSRSSNRPLLYVKTAKANHSPYGHLQLVGLGAPRNHSSLFGGSAISLMGSMGHASSETDSHLPKRPRSSSILNSTSPTMNDSNSPQNLRSPPVAESVNATGPSKAAPFLPRTLSKAPMNPRDHSLLEIIYNEMLACRFINISPLSLLATYLEYHFKDTRTHPPLQYTFPAMPVKSSDSSSVQRDANSDDSDLEEEGSPNRSQSYITRNSPGPDPHSIHDVDGQLSTQSILLHTSPYVTLDGARTPAYSPSTKAVFPKKNNDGKLEFNQRTKSRLPNQTLHIDLRTLNLHLAIRAREILACSESMWEWVLEYQAKVQAQKKLSRPRPTSFEASYPYISQTSIVSGNSFISTESTKSALLEITRDDFDYILSNFELDMQDKISLGHALKERFSWSVLSSSPSINRKAFDAACEKHDEWVAQQRQQTSSHSFRHVHNHHSSNTLSDSDKVSDNAINSREGTSMSMARNQSQIISSHPGEGESLKSTPLSHDATAHFASPSPTASAHSTVPSPTQRLSRSVRVFVAWKAKKCDITL